MLALAIGSVLLGLMPLKPFQLLQIGRPSGGCGRFPMIPSVLLAAAPATPLVLLLACLWRRARDRMTELLWLAPIPALAAALLAAGAPPLVLDRPLVRVTLALDLPGAMLLGAAALLWVAAGAYTRTYLRGRPDGGRFAVFWLLTLTGSLSIFMAADMASFFLAYCMVSLAAYGLVVHDSRRARGAPAASMWPLRCWARRCC